MERPNENPAVAWILKNQARVRQEGLGQDVIPRRRWLKSKADDQLLIQRMVLPAAPHAHTTLSRICRLLRARASTSSPYR